MTDIRSLEPETHTNMHWRFWDGDEECTIAVPKHLADNEDRAHAIALHINMVERVTWAKGRDYGRLTLASDLRTLIGAVAKPESEYP